jgi:hypothetical protein
MDPHRPAALIASALALIPRDIRTMRSGVAMAPVVEDAEPELETVPG